MKSRTLKRAVLAGLTLMGGVVSAESALPWFIERHIERTVEEANVVVVGTVTQAPNLSSDQPSFRMSVDETLMGEVAPSIKLSTRGFVESDLQAGTQLLVPLRTLKTRLIHTQRYEVIVEGRIREYATGTYLARVKKAVQQKLARSNAAVAAKL